MANTIWVQAQTHDRKVIISEADESHPTPTHELWIVGYEDPRFDADGNPIEPANPPIEVGDTPGVRAKIATGELAIVDHAPMARQQAETPQQREERLSAERREQELADAERERAAAAQRATGKK